MDACLTWSVVVVVVVVRGWSWQPQQGSPSGSQVQIELHIGTFGTVDEHNFNLEDVRERGRKGEGEPGHTQLTGARSLLAFCIQQFLLRTSRIIIIIWNYQCLGRAIVAAPLPPHSPSLSVTLAVLLSLSLSVCCWSKGLLCSCCSSTVFRLLCLLYDNVLSPSPSPLPCLPLTLLQFSVVFLVILRHSVGIVVAAVVVGRLPVDDYYVCLNSMHVPALKLICIEYD